MQLTGNDSLAKAPNGMLCDRIPLGSKVFSEICRIVYEHSGIKMNPGKEELVRSRLMKRLRFLGLESFDKYLKLIKEDKTARELNAMIDSLTTNKTSFFREKQHFEYLRNRILPALRCQGKGTRIWSAGCSSGEEPYSIAMLLCEEWPDADRTPLKILATDICTGVLEKARLGEYGSEHLQEVPPHLLTKYFRPAQTRPSRIYRVTDRIKKMVRFARLNLIGSWPMKGSFDVIFCRNVMIYFDSETQRELVKRFSGMLAPGGYLLVGHSESLVTSSCELKYVQPATYVK